ncbi:DNA-binding protein [candidate division WOR-1 bacterium RIFOXYA12_FULL_52_29]|uniref:DNA-binding protein n=1 Tax=candidate division WOR-1 bacterium RIFOXYC12_FULL_54_18 TaxID=1802584 RepID=A0A1F4T4V1_UNCSA|nr:MAG: DNA-binding protein [candidate division WOR-1 bacterium RIFOXYA2_FULL_51_19]OGC17418.1 MAG: DNA-binding protein [candidate division WOR-1 bacterium RIFOXYA12_FULL_52_29]OGC26277.1 MAG: DNA-binding protein [candidate division WOR-1 bacterium RIFOXYB2_FULL_45_9]OGC27835.1 MAG: DNA-binding protein [candidate division WOR-1 bacterium RIFOXYC12_FULL_54_18]OGC29876.1 MAG: DNA-binding protein [candidate division WOR-1 bacterium RIFOXYB12_FULL_52_16]
MVKNKKVVVQGSQIGILLRDGDNDFISLTDMTKKFGDDVLIYQWMRNRNTVEFLGIWEQIHNPDFKGVEFETFKKQAGMNSFSLTPRKWVDATGAIGLISRAGRYGGGTYAHKDIAFEFGSWLSAEFKLYLIKEFQRLKTEENQRFVLGWDMKRMLAKLNYKIHTDAIKEHIVPPQISKQKMNVIYASEADVLNVALFGITAKEWRDKNIGKEGNVRDSATVEQLVVLSNLESMNAELIRLGLPQGERLRRLNEMAISQMKSLMGNTSIRKLK